MPRPSTTLLACLLAAPALASSSDEVIYALGADSEVAVPWNARAVRHLFNRAGFGLPERELAPYVSRSPEEVVDELLRGPGPLEPFFAHRPGLDQYRDMAGLDDAAKRRVRAEVRSADKRQLRDYANTWVEDMLEHTDPLRDRMTLFWHGFFTSSTKSLRRNYELVRQHELLRANALGSYAEMLAAIVRDPAMIYYLDNSSNEVGSPNENLARELMELFSLGEGNYTEGDVKEVARALTGYTADRDGNFSFERKKHDEGEKEILGERGRFDGDDVAQILLRQPACAEWVAGRIVEYLEGVAPSSERRTAYAGLLRSSGYDVSTLLRALLLDPAFYRDEVVGTRVQGPVELVVSSARRLGVRPPAVFLVEAAGSCGQVLFQPPNVKGWEEGEAWITTSTLLQRGNVAGLMLGVIDLDAAFQPGPRTRGADARRMDSMEMESMDSMESMQERTPGKKRGAGEPQVPETLKDLEKALGGKSYTPRLNLTWRVQQAGARTDAELVDALLANLLAIDAPVDVRPPLVRFLRMERERNAIEEGRFLNEPERCEEALRRLAHLILSLPEAQLS